MLTGTKVKAIDDSGQQVRVTVSKGGQEQVLETDKMLQAIGFLPQVASLGNTERQARQPSPTVT